MHPQAPPISGGRMHPQGHALLLSDAWVALPEQAGAGKHPPYQGGLGSTPHIACLGMCTVVTWCGAGIWL